MKDDTFYQVFFSYFMKLLFDQNYVKAERQIHNYKLITKTTHLFI